MKEMIRRFRQAGVCVALGMVVGLTGCATMLGRTSSEVDLSLTSTGTVIMNGKVIRQSDLSHVLKSAGAGPATRIVVATDASAPMAAISSLTGQLATAGYGNVIFKRPRHAEANVVTRPGH